MPTRRKIYDDDTIQQVCTLHTDGRTNRQISDQLGLSLPVIITILYRYLDIGTGYGRKPDTVETRLVKVREYPHVTLYSVRVKRDDDATSTTHWEHAYYECFKEGGVS